MVKNSNEKTVKTKPKSERRFGEGLKLKKKRKCLEADAGLKITNMYAQLKRECCQPELRFGGIKTPQNENVYL